jgi:DegV family protein with EDD domain
MRDYVILSDTSCDLGKELRIKYNIEYVKMPIFVDGKELLCDLDYADFSPEQFYNWIKEGKKSIKTTQVNPAQYEEVFESYLKNDLDILYIGVSSGLSGSVNSSRIAKDTMMEKYPKAKIVIVDALISSLGEGFLAIDAAKKKMEGLNITDVAKYIESIKMNYHQLGTVLDLKYLRKAGRVSGPAAFVGSIVHIKPLIVSDLRGANYSFKKVLGRRKSIDAAVAYVTSNITNPQEQVVGITHANCYADTLKLKEKLIHEVGVKDVYINWVNPIIGTSVGPGMIGIYFYGVPRSIQE